MSALPEPIEPPASSASQPAPSALEPFAANACVRIVEAGRERVVVEQPPARELDNHVGVRHASALHAAAYEASRLLVATALSQGGLRASMRLRESDVAYTSVGLGRLMTVAEPSGSGWDSLESELDRGSEVELECAVTTSDERGKQVIRLTASWALAPAA